MSLGSTVLLTTVSTASGLNSHLMSMASGTTNHKNVSAAARTIKSCRLVLSTQQKTNRPLRESHANHPLHNSTQLLEIRMIEESDSSHYPASESQLQKWNSNERVHTSVPDIIQSDRVSACQAYGDVSSSCYIDGTETDPLINDRVKLSNPIDELNVHSESQTGNPEDNSPTIDYTQSPSDQYNPSHCELENVPSATSKLKSVIKESSTKNKDIKRKISITRDDKSTCNRSDRGSPFNVLKIKRVNSVPKTNRSIKQITPQHSVDKNLSGTNNQPSSSGESSSPLHREEHQADEQHILLTQTASSNPLDLQDREKYTSPDNLENETNDEPDLIHLTGFENSIQQSDDPILSVNVDAEDCVTKTSLNRPNVVLSKNNTTNNLALVSDPRSRTCCFCWCCCCSCSCMRVRANLTEPKRHSSSNDHRSKIEEFTMGEKLTHEEVRSWADSFQCLMQSPGGLGVFREFLRSEYSEENILFWLACEELKKETNPELVEEKARMIYEDFISILSPREVSLDSKVREVINANMIEPTPGTFDEAQLQIYTLMQRDSYLRFLNSKIYKDLVEQTSIDKSESSLQ